MLEDIDCDKYGEKLPIHVARYRGTKIYDDIQGLFNSWTSVNFEMFIGVQEVRRCYVIIGYSQGNKRVETET